MVGRPKLGPMPTVAPVQSVQSPESGEARACADAEPPIGLSIDIVHEAGDWKDFGDVEAAVRAAADAVAAELELGSSEACLALSDDTHVAELNGAYRGKPKPTNVLSFPAGEPPGEVPQTRHLGDVILAAETVVREAAEQDIAPADHLRHLVVHGLLHLLGYDHQTDAEAEVMEGLEVRILASLGIANPYETATKS